MARDAFRLTREDRYYNDGFGQDRPKSPHRFRDEPRLELKDGNDGQDQTPVFSIGGADPKTRGKAKRPNIVEALDKLRLLASALETTKAKTVYDALKESDRTWLREFMADYEPHEKLFAQYNLNELTAKVKQLVAVGSGIAAQAKRTKNGLHRPAA